MDDVVQPPDGRTKNDPDETEGRRLYRASANSLARAQVAMSSRQVKLRVPKALEAIADAVLAYRPKPKSKPAKRRNRRAAKIAKEAK